MICSLSVLETSSLMIDLLSVHLRLNQISLRESFMERVFKKSLINSDASEGLLRSELELYLYENLGISELK